MTAGGYYIRPYVEADRPQLRWLYQRNTPGARGQDLPADLESVAAHYAAFWVAVLPSSEGEELVGSLGLTPAGSSVGPEEPDFVSKSGAGRLNRLVIAADWQGAGLDRELVEGAAEAAGMAGMSSLIIDLAPTPEAAIAMERLGFVSIGKATAGDEERAWFERKLQG